MTVTRTRLKLAQCRIWNPCRSHVSLFLLSSVPLSVRGPLRAFAAAPRSVQTTITLIPRRMANANASHPRTRTTPGTHQRDFTSSFSRSLYLRPALLLPALLLRSTTFATAASHTPPVIVLGSSMATRLCSFFAHWVSRSVLRSPLLGAHRSPRTRPLPLSAKARARSGSRGLRANMTCRPAHWTAQKSV